MDVDPEIWGPFFWELLFNVAHKMLDKTRCAAAGNDFSTFFKLANRFIPCDGCREHYEDFLARCCEPLECGDIGQEFLFPLKNSVNRKLGKPELGRDIYLKRRENYPGCVDPRALEVFLRGVAERFADASDLQAWLRACRKIINL